MLCVILHAFYSATETAFACLNKYKFQVEADEGRRSSRFVLWLREHFETTLISGLIGTNVAAIIISTISTFLFIAWLSPVMGDSPATLISSIAMAVVTFFFGDTLPKFIAKRAPDTVARLVAYPMVFFFFLFYPISIIFRLLSILLKKIFHDKGESDFTEEDFASEIEKKEAAGDLESNESDIIVASLDFAETSVKEVFTPRKRMAMLDMDGLTTEKLLEYLKKCPYSRIPLYYRDPDKVLRVLVVKNYLSAYFRDPRAKYLDYATKPYFVTPGVKMDDLLDGFREHHTQIAIVRKEGRCIGMVTTEDVLEELVGGIKEKGNPAAEEAL